MLRETTKRHFVVTQRINSSIFDTGMTYQQTYKPKERISQAKPKAFETRTLHGTEILIYYVTFLYATNGLSQLYMDMLIHSK
jgi:hypothetical protein